MPENNAGEALDAAVDGATPMQVVEPVMTEQQQSEFDQAAAEYRERQLADAQEAVQNALSKIEDTEKQLEAARDAHAEAVADLEAVENEVNV